MSSNALLAELEKDKEERRVRSVKVVVWDLDHTVWNGVLLEDESVALIPGIVDVIQELDRRGILQSISSKNDHATAMARLAAFGLAEYFLYPQINWGSKAASVQAIATAINVGIDSIAFIDDQSFEREEVAYSHPDVLCVDAVEAGSILERSEFIPRFVTDESKSRRLMYLSDIQRNEVEEKFEGPKEDFLATLGLKLTLGRATEKDLQRAEELTKRTHQLNTTGRTYSYDELKAIMESPDHELLIAGLEDKFGTYGKIGLCLLERAPEHWTVKLLLMSCRVMSRGVGTIIINYLVAEAHKAGVRLRAEFIRTDRNRMMYITYRFSHFQDIGEVDGVSLLENDCSVVSDYPAYASVHIVDGIGSREREFA
ncbi:HAD-IIIC family phosphatase [Dyella sp. LX-66]|uniref:HAD-IIIC family phosphatase n=1 Tax=unclassified Dyella TaxID=2634549 RepID=UPI001BE0CD04|nr:MULTISPECIES: HAD-IIIC family phosphatase [unclassified Dyella]MBT2118877.1 HAD-IIIC family phosphatase [Dyella sp. LX-1]MBT2140130.1 HAD-IIIC family phosphatase [Dyella sp. LX-66]